MESSTEAILLEMKSTAAEIARLDGRLVRQVVSFIRASSTKRGMAEELAMALCLTKAKAQALISRAEGLVDRFPQVLSLVEDGRVPMASATAVHDAATWLSVGKVDLVDDVMAGRLVGKNPTQARRSANAAVARADPEGFAARTRRQQEARVFRMRHGASGMAGLVLENLPVKKATAAYVSVDKRACLLKTGDETRTLGQLRADVALDMLLGKQFGGDAKAACTCTSTSSPTRASAVTPPTSPDTARSRRHEHVTSPPVPRQCPSGAAPRRSPDRWWNRGVAGTGRKPGSTSWYGAAIANAVALGVRGLRSPATSTTATAPARAGTAVPPGRPKFRGSAGPSANPTNPSAGDTP